MTNVKKILLVDDDVIPMLARSKFLTDNGYIVVTAVSGEQALDISRSEGDIDMVLMDIDPGSGMGGAESAELMLAEKEIPVLFLLSCTLSCTDREIVEKTAGIMSYGYVVKESGDAVLLASIKTAFRLYDARMDLIRREKELNASSTGPHLPDSRFEAAGRERSIDYVKNSPYGVFITENSGIFLEVNPAAAEITGFTEKELIGRNIREFMRPGTESDGLDSFMENARRGRTSGEFPVVRADGAFRYWSVETVPLPDSRYLGFVMDVTKRRRDETTHKRQHRFISTLIETIPNPVYYKDIELKYLGCNRAFEKLTGKNRDEIIGKTVYQLHEYELAKRYDESDRKLLTEPGTRYYEWKIKTGFGEYRDVIFSMSTFSGPDNEVEGIVGVMTDITDMKNSEIAMSRAIEENRTLYMELQHRVKNTMNIITGIINIECENMKDSPAVKPLEIIKNRVFTLSELYSLLYVSGNANVVQLDRYFENIVATLDLTLVRNSGLRISTRCASIGAEYRVATSLGLILNELVTNACKYSGSGNTDGWIEVRLSSDGMNIILEVEDNGAGLPADFNIKKASSLGLQLVSGLAQQHRGSVDVITGGTTLFRVTVPWNRK